MVKNYKEHLEPKLAPFITPNPPAAKTQVKTHENLKRQEARFLNLSSASLSEIRAAVITRVNACFVPSTFSKRALVRLWKNVFDGPNGPEEEDQTEYSGSLHFFSVAQLPGKQRDVLRYHLQCAYPHIFVPINACTEPILAALYERLIHGNIDLDGQLCVGVHFFFIEQQDDSSRSDHGKSEESVTNPKMEVDSGSKKPTLRPLENTDEEEVLASSLL